MNVVRNSKGVTVTENGGFGGVDGPHRIGRISEGEKTASGLVFILELIVRTSTRLVMDCEGVVLVSVCDEEIEEKKFPCTLVQLIVVVYRAATQKVNNVA